MHSSRDTGAKPYIRNPFFRVRRISHSQFFDILSGPMCSTKWHNFLQTEILQLKKKVKTYLLSKRLAPPSGKFSTRTPNVLHSIYRTLRARQSCECEILKLHTVLEILAKNPKLKTHFFRGSENVLFAYF